MTEPAEHARILAVDVPLEVSQLEPMVRFFEDVLGFVYSPRGLGGKLQRENVTLSLAKTTYIPEKRANRRLTLHVLGIEALHARVKAAGYSVTDLDGYKTTCVVSAPE